MLSVTMRNGFSKTHAPQSQLDPDASPRNISRQPNRSFNTCCSWGLSSPHPVPGLHFSTWCQRRLQGIGVRVVIRNWLPWGAYSCGCRELRQKVSLRIAMTLRKNQWVRWSCMRMPWTRRWVAASDSWH